MTYLTICQIALREAYNAALPFNSVRHSLETNSQELVYVPTFKGIPLLSGFSIPIYRILDIDMERLTTSLFPKEIPSSLYHELKMDTEECTQWRLSIGYLGAIQMLIGQYNEVAHAISEFDTACNTGVARYITLFMNQMSEYIGNFSSDITLPLNILKAIANDDISYVVGAIQEALNMLGQIAPSVRTLSKIEELENKLENASGLMALLMPDILNEIKDRNSAR